MTKTRAKFVEFIISKMKEFGGFRAYVSPFSELNFMIDALIKEGWVELDKPREFWIMKYCNNIQITSEKHPIENENNLGTPNEIIHVREVIEDENK